MEPAEAPIAPAKDVDCTCDPEPTPRYLFHSTIESANADKFKINLLQGHFWAPNNFKAGDPVCIYIEPETLPSSSDNPQG